MRLKRPLCISSLCHQRSLAKVCSWRATRSERIPQKRAATPAWTRADCCRLDTRPQVEALAWYRLHTPLFYPEELSGRPRQQAMDGSGVNLYVILLSPMSVNNWIQ